VVGEVKVFVFLLYVLLLFSPCARFLPFVLPIEIEKLGSLVEVGLLLYSEF